MNGLEFQLLAGILFVLGGIAAVVLWVLPFGSRSHGSIIPGTLTVNRHKYPYELGDNILRFGGASLYSGIELMLPKRLPHIFLDAHANDRPGGRPEFVFDGDNRISLEGNFDNSFQAYAPKQQKTLALSILTPDVLQALMKHATKFDIEIFGHYVRLIVPSGRLVSRDESLQTELLDAAKAVVKEIDHRLKSWNESSLTGDTSLDVQKHSR